MPATDIETLLNIFTSSISQQQFVKLTLSDRRDKSSELKNVFVKPLMLKTGYHLSFVYRYPTKDVTKNYSPEESLTHLSGMLEKGFYKADLFTTLKSYHLTGYKNGKTVLAQKLAVGVAAPVVEHDKAKKRYVIAENNIYLRELGIATAEGNVKGDRQDKFRQINKYVEIVESIVQSAELPEHFRIADMGCGKGYLTFALYDYLVNTMQLKPEVIGVELRQELVDTCNKIVAKAGFEKLHFSSGSIESSELPKVDLLIALHACDTATDQAIYRGIKNDSQIIICAPCCHKQVRKAMHPLNDLKAITRFGILEERQAEILTDAIRALILEAFGYKVKVFEFISTEHTPKNVMIAAVKSKTTQLSAKEEALEKIKNLKAFFNLEYHELERLMGL